MMIMILYLYRMPVQTIQKDNKVTQSSSMPPKENCSHLQMDLNH